MYILMVIFSTTVSRILLSHKSLKKVGTLSLFISLSVFLPYYYLTLTMFLWQVEQIGFCLLNHYRIPNPWTEHSSSCSSPNIKKHWNKNMSLLMLRLWQKCCDFVWRRPNTLSFSQCSSPDRPKNVQVE